MDFNDVLVQLNKLTRMSVTVQVLPLVDGQGELLATFGGTLEMVAEGQPGDWYLWFADAQGTRHSSLVIHEAKVRDAYWPEGVEVGSQFNIIHGDTLLALHSVLPESML